MQEHWSKLSQDEEQVQRENNKICMEQYRIRLSEEERQEQREKSQIGMQEYRSKLTEEEEQVHREKAQLGMQEYRTRLSEHELEVRRIRDRVQYQESRRPQITSVKDSNFDNITHDDLIRIEKEWQEDDSTCNVSKNLQDAILCYYLNSGYARFNEHLSYS